MNRKTNLQSRIIFYYGYTFFALSIPFAVKYLLLYNITYFCLYIYSGCFYISLFIILAFEDISIKKMMEEVDFELYSKLMNDKYDGFLSLFTKLDGSNWRNSNTQMQNYFKESFPQYWEYASKLRHWFLISILLNIVLRGLI